MCLDFDGIPGITSFEELLPSLSPVFGGVSYVEQLSASAGIEPDKGYSAHVFMFIEPEASPTQLKEWLTRLNFTTTLLRNHIRLNPAGTALHWPLDITTPLCQHD